MGAPPDDEIHVNTVTVEFKSLVAGGGNLLGTKKILLKKYKIFKFVFGSLPPINVVAFSRTGSEQNTVHADTSILY